MKFMAAIGTHGGRQHPKNVLTRHKGCLSWPKNFMGNRSDAICGHLCEDFRKKNNGVVALYHILAFGRKGIDTKIQFHS
jgi:hypothetical protein